MRKHKYFKQTLNDLRTIAKTIKGMDFNDSKKYFSNRDDIDVMNETDGMYDIAYKSVNLTIMEFLSKAKISFFYGIDVFDDKHGVYLGNYSLDELKALAS